MSKSAKKVLEEGYKLVGQWTASPKVNIVPLLEALKQYDQARFFEAVEEAIYELKAGVATSKNHKEKEND